MPSVPREIGRMKEAKISIKEEEGEQKHLDNIPSQSTITQFIRSGQAAFGSVDPQLLLEHKQTPSEVQRWMLDQINERLAAASDLYHDDILILRPLLKLEYSNNSTGLHVLLLELSRLMKSNLTYAVTFTNHVLDGPADEVPQALKDHLLRAVAQDFGALSIDMRENGAIERQLALFDGKNQEGNQARPLAKLSASAFGLFTKYFYNLRLYDQIETMLIHLGPEIAHGHSIDIHTIYIPYLQELIGMMLMYGIPMTNVTYSSFFENVLRSYFELFVGKEPRHSQGKEHETWVKRALAARSSLESFDHSYFREILGIRYDNAVLPALMSLPGSSPGSSAHDRYLP